MNTFAQQGIQLDQRACQMRPYLDGEPASAAKVDAIEDAVAKLPQCEIPTVHRFTPSLYIRERRPPKGALIVSMVHKTEHPFVLSQGAAVIWDGEDGVQRIKAPFCGITKPGTRRIIYCLEECVWTTFHVTSLTDPEEIEEEIIYHRPGRPQLRV